MGTGSCRSWRCFSEPTVYLSQQGARGLALSQALCLLHGISQTRPFTPFSFPGPHHCLKKDKLFIPSSEKVPIP